MKVVRRYWEVLFVVALQLVCAAHPLQPDISGFYSGAMLGLAVGGILCIQWARRNCPR